MKKEKSFDDWIEVEFVPDPMLVVNGTVDPERKYYAQVDLEEGDYRLLEERPDGVKSDAGEEITPFEAAQIEMLLEEAGHSLPPKIHWMIMEAPYYT